MFLSNLHLSLAFRPRFLQGTDATGWGTCVMASVVQHAAGTNHALELGQLRRAVFGQHEQWPRRRRGRLAVEALIGLSGM